MAEKTVSSDPLPSALRVLPAEVPEIDLHELSTRARLVDIRSPKEFANDHIPGSISVPLLDDRERAVVGTLHRHAGADEARDWGYARVARRLEIFTEALRGALALPAAGEAPGTVPRVVVCARGGQRSHAVTCHLRAFGYPVVRLRGGYRSYRRVIRERLRTLHIPRPFVLNGLTGSGKTLILREILKRFPRRVVDLEGLAQHRSSLFGDIGLQPVSQRRFESRLVAAIENLEGPWSLFEWEARRIGNRELPAAVHAQLRRAPQLMLTASLAQRVRILCDEYLPAGSLHEIRLRLPALARYPHFGREGVVRLDKWLRAGRVQDVARALLELHYDPRYRHGNRELNVMKEFSLATTRETAAAIVSWIEAL